MSDDNHHGFFHNIEKSAVITIIGIILLFAISIAVVLIAPNYIDPTWTQPSNPYQVQMYEVADPNIYISSAGGERQLVYHIKENFTLLAFEEDDFIRIIASPELEKYITRLGDPKMKLTSRLLMLRTPQNTPDFKAIDKAVEVKKQLNEKWNQTNADKVDAEKEDKPAYEILELYVPEGHSAFARTSTDGILENWVDKNYIILDEALTQDYHRDNGVIYVHNPMEYRISHFRYGEKESWRYDPRGQKIENLEVLKSPQLGFLSREELIKTGEHIYTIEGCWYCHTDQTRTLVQDVVLNGSDSYPAPPSSANEYIYQRITFPGTRRIGPDISRVGVKRPSRDWHRGHFWSPKTASAGSIMPSFQHFFDNDPRGTGQRNPNLPNYKFEAIYQYLMTKGTRITPPTQAWWLGKDPIDTKGIIEGMRTLDHFQN